VASGCARRGPRRGEAAAPPVNPALAAARLGTQEHRENRVADRMTRFAGSTCFVPARHLVLEWMPWAWRAIHSACSRRSCRWRPSWPPAGPPLIGSAQASGLRTLLVGAPLLVLLARQLAAGRAHLQLLRRDDDGGEGGATTSPTHGDPLRSPGWCGGSDAARRHARNRAERRASGCSWHRSRVRRQRQRDRRSPSSWRPGAPGRPARSAGRPRRRPGSVRASGRAARTRRRSSCRSPRRPPAAAW
jgi:hypothetical protein